MLGAQSRPHTAAGVTRGARAGEVGPGAASSLGLQRGAAASRFSQLRQGCGPGRKEAAI